MSCATGDSSGSFPASPPTRNRSCGAGHKETIVELPKITFWKRFGSLIAFLAICLIFGILSDRFFTISNFMNVARQVSINAIVACGMTLVIITGGIDLSVGSIVG